jgi:hypothetical protein
VTGLILHEHEDFEVHVQIALRQLHYVGDALEDFQGQVFIHGFTEGCLGSEPRAFASDELEIQVSRHRSGPDLVKAV